MRTARHLGIVLALALVLAAGALAGCGSSNSTASSTTATKPAGLTAKAAYALAIASVATSAPDGKLLVCQAADTLTATATPVWEYLIGSPKTNKVFAVLVQNGKAQASEYGSAGLTPAEWSAVPSTDQWQVDSPQAHDNAVKVYPTGKDAAYFMGFVTYVPKSAAKNASPSMTWIVSFDPKSLANSHATTSTINVDMRTGAATIPK
jgi:hypothetical protein